MNRQAVGAVCELGMLQAQAVTAALFLEHTFEHAIVSADEADGIESG